MQLRREKLSSCEDQRLLFVSNLHFSNQQTIFKLSIQFWKTEKGECLLINNRFPESVTLSTAQRTTCSFLISASPFDLGTDSLTIYGVLSSLMTFLNELLLLFNFSWRTFCLFFITPLPFPQFSWSECEPINICWGVHWTTENYCRDSNDTNLLWEISSSKSHWKELR